jgi:hypothetical protein
LRYRAFAAFEQSLEQCPHCQRRFVPKAFKHHSNACTAARPAKPAGTGLIANSLSNRLVPGAIAGSMHGNASECISLSSYVTHPLTKFDICLLNNVISIIKQLKQHKLDFILWHLYGFTLIAYLCDTEAPPPKIQKNIALYRSSMKEKIMDVRSQRDGNISLPSTIDHVRLWLLPPTFFSFIYFYCVSMFIWTLLSS